MSNINFGNWQDLDKLQAQNQWVDPHANAFGGLLRTLDPMTYIPGVNAVANPIHDAGDAAVTGINTALSPVVGGAQKLTETITPGLKQFNQATGMDNVDNFVKNKPFDTAAIMAATFFSGGAAANAMGAGAAAAPAAAEGAGAGAAGGLSSFGAAGSAAITPAFESGAVAGTGAGAGAMGSTTGSLAGASGAGTLGTAGTSAATSALTPAFESMGASSPGLLGQIQDGYNLFNKYDQYRRNLSKFGQPDNTKNNNYNASMALADQVLNSNDPRQERIKRISNKIVMNRWG